MKRNKKGISLITLVITIIIMIILAAAIVLTLTQSGIFDKANEATGKYNLQQVQAIADLAWSEAYADGERDVTKLQEAVDEALEDNELDDKYEAIADEKGVTVKEKEEKIIGITAETITFEDAQKEEMLQKTVNSKTFDEYGNQIVIPAGFKIRVDSDAGRLGDEKTTATHVTEGIVIEDKDGNQFVWVPVGNIKTASGTKTITLGRYAYDEYTGTNDYIPDENGVYTPGTNIIVRGTEYIEETVTNSGLSQYGNAIARNIEDFIVSSNQNKGYYIGRFEAGKENDKLVCKAGQTVYTDITQPDSSTACKKMYNEGEDGYKANTFSSDLINSYAWDTAIIFIQTFGGANNYWQENKSTSRTTAGVNQDEYCNINDMSGNVYEWSTETYTEIYDGSSYPCVFRGGYCDTGSGPFNYTGNRPCYIAISPDSYVSFRPLLYVAVTE